MKMVREAILTLFTLLAIVATVRFTLAVWLGQKIVTSQEWAGGNQMPILTPSPVGRETGNSGETHYLKQLVGFEPTTFHIIR